jgi:GTPase SAR1 family protein
MRHWVAELMNVLPGYRDAKYLLTTAAARLADFFERREAEALLARARELGERIAAERLNMVVLGQFKRGKSTLINALLGADLLPTAVVPLTSVVTLIEYGHEPRAVVSFLDGRQMDIQIQDISRYTTERDNPNNAKGVAQVLVSFPSEFLRDGVRLVDTPGVGSVFAANTGVTYDYLPESDVAIFLLAADQPISQAEVEFLHRARRWAAKFFFVQNKIDYLTTDELEESLEFSTSVITESLGSAVTIYPVSARKALAAQINSDKTRLGESRLPDLVRDLTEFLLREKETTLLHSIRSRLHALVSAALDSIEIERSALRMPAEVVTECAEAFQRRADDIVQERSDTQYLLRGEINELIAQVETSLRSFVDDNVQPLRRRMNEAFERNKLLGKSGLIKAMNQEMSGAIEDTFAPWREDQEHATRESFARITSRFVERANRIITDVQKLVADLFDVKITAIIELEPFTAESSHYYYIEDPFSLQLSALPLLLPGVLARAYIKREYLRVGREELDRNAGRLRADFQERLEKSARSFKSSFDERVRITLESLRRTIVRAAHERKRSESELATADEVFEREHRILGEILMLIDGYGAQETGIARVHGDSH